MKTILAVLTLMVAVQGPTCVRDRCWSIDGISVTETHRASGRVLQVWHVGLNADSLSVSDDIRFVCAVDRETGEWARIDRMLVRVSRGSIVPCETLTHKHHSR